MSQNFVKPQFARITAACCEHIFFTSFPLKIVHIKIYKLSDSKSNWLDSISE